jgi:hypothetical protein
MGRKIFTDPRRQNQRSEWSSTEPQRHNRLLKRGCPFYQLQSGRLDVMGQRIQVNEPYRIQCAEAMEGLVKKL